MSDYIDISILGDKALQRRLANMDVNLQKKFVRQAINRAMLPVKNKAQALAPVDTGRLRSSIKRRSRTRRGISRAQVITGTRAELGIPVGSTGYYPAAIEYGTRKQPARSFMRKALTDLRGHVLKKTGELIDGYIRKSR